MQIEQENILYKQEFDSWQNLNKNLKIVYALELQQQQQEGKEKEQFDKSKWNGEIGRINKDMVMKYLNADDIVNAVFYICGPPGMLNAMKDLLTKEMGITKGRIREEEFYGY